MVELTLLNTSQLVQIVIICVAVAIAFLAAGVKGGGIIWFVDCFIWVGVVVTWNNTVVQSIGCVMAVVAVALFILD